MLSLIIKTTQFLVYHLLIVVVDRVSRLPRSGVQPEVERLLRENLALKAQVRALVLELKSERGARPKVSLRTRAAQVFAYLLTRGDSAFQNYYLSASSTTIERWATKLRRGPWPWRNREKGGRPPLAQELKDLIVELKTALSPARSIARAVSPAPWSTTTAPTSSASSSASSASWRSRDAAPRWPCRL